MAGNILSIGKSGLFAAQVGMATTGHNITNANVAGYSRQVAVQATALPQDLGYGFAGNGTVVSDITRYTDDFLNAQVRTAQASTSALDAFNAQISQVDNLLSDPTSGLSPALQDFFKGVQDLTSNPTSTASRQALLSSADTLAARFQGLNGRLQEIRDGVNTQITSNITLINSYAQQIAKLNGDISALGGSGSQPNDLLDKRDQLIADLNKQIKATVVKGDNNSLTISIGNGQPLVVGNTPFQLAAMNSTSDPARLEVGYVTGAGVAAVPQNSLTGGELGGLLDFRTNALDRAQNSLGRVATALAQTFNAQHKLGQDDAGNLGTAFFNVAAPVVIQNTTNSAGATMAVSAAVSDATKLTQSDYKLAFNGTNYVVTRLSDNKQTTISPFPQIVPQTVDGVDFSVSGSAAAGDSYLVRPTINGAAQFSLLVTDRAKIAVAAPISTSVPLTNKGSGTISPGTVDVNYLTPGNKLLAPVTLAYAQATTSLSGFPATQAITVTSNGVPTVYAAGFTPIPYVAGASYSFGGINVTLGGLPANGDTFSIAPNTSGVGDSRNMGLLGKLQTTPILDGSSATYQSAYAELVSFVGNKAREVQVNSQASTALLAQANQAQQSVSGVNLDEEAANLLKYQQAYQAAGKVMQIANTLFDTLLTLGH